MFDCKGWISVTMKIAPVRKSHPVQIPWTHNHAVVGLLYANTGHSRTCVFCLQRDDMCAQ